MEENHYLNPDAIKEQNLQGIIKIKLDSENLDIAENYITEFLLEEQLSSEAYDALREVMELYQYILDDMRDLNDAEIQDLMSSCGQNKEFAHKNPALQDKISLSDKSCYLRFLFF